MDKLLDNPTRYLLATTALWLTGGYVFSYLYPPHTSLLLALGLWFVNTGLGLRTITSPKHSRVLNLFTVIGLATLVLAILV